MEELGIALIRRVIVYYIHKTQVVFVLDEGFLNLPNLKNLLRCLKYRFLGSGLESSFQ